MQKNAILNKLSTSELWSLLTTYRKLYMGFSRNPLLDHKIQDGWDPPSWKSTSRHFFCRGWSDLDKISQTSAEWHVDCGDMVKIDTRCRIPIRRTFLRIPWHVPEPPATLQGAATWWIRCHDREPHATLQGAVTWRNQCLDRATLQGVIIPSAILKIVFGHILFFVLMQFRLWRAAAFVSSPIHLLH